MPEQRKTIVVGVDDSEPSKWAQALAAELAGELGAQLKLVHVFIPPIAGVSEIPIPVDDIRDRLRADAEAMLAEAKGQVPAGVPVETVVREGSPPRELVTIATAGDAAFVVIGTHGRGRLATFIMGSTAEAVIRAAPCPVITVSHEPKAKKGNGRVEVSVGAGT